MWLRGWTMADPAATLRALADACDECDRFDRVIRGRSGCDSAQRDALMCALPHGGWPETATTLRTMADTVDRLTRERDEARALLTTPKPKRDPLTDPIPSGPPIHGITAMLNEFMEPGAMMLVCGSAAFARIKSEVPNA